MVVLIGIDGQADGRFDRRESMYYWVFCRHVNGLVDDGHLTGIFDLRGLAC